MELWNSCNIEISFLLLAVDLSSLDGVIRYLGSRDRDREQRTKNCVTARPELRSGRWLLVTRRCFV